MERISYAIVLFLLSGIAVSAQTRGTTAPATRPAPGTAATVPDSKIAFVDTEMFGDDNGGIKRFVAAVKTVENEFKARTTEVQNMQTRLTALATELQKLTTTAGTPQATIQAKNDEGQRLQVDFNNKRQLLNADYQKRYAAVVQPISTDIGKALDQYMTSHGLSLILDISKLAPAVLSANPAMDITKDFIADYNTKNP
jgi:Skp family chaperone for outer membrane proteins